MAFVTLVVSIPNATVEQLNAKVVQPGAHKELNLLIDFLSGLAGGTMNGTFYVTSRTTDPTVTTAGTNSLQITYSLA